MAVSKNSYVWAAPMKPQMPTVQVQNAASAPTYAWGRQPAPVLVSRQTTRVMVRPLPPAPVVVARRTIRVVVKPAQVVVRAAAPPQLPRLLGSPRKASTAHPVKGPKAGVGEPAPHVTAVEDAKPGPHDVTAPNEVTETGNTEAVLEASAPVFELVHPKGRPVSYGPARPFLILKAEEDCPQPKTDVPNEPAPKPAPKPAPEPAPPAEVSRPPQEPPEELPGEAEALEALKALMAELGGKGFKVPQKPTGEPEVGDLVVLSSTIKPESLRLRYAVILQVHEKHFTARALAEDKATCLEDCWPNKEDAVLDSKVGRLGSRVRIVEGTNGGCSGKVAKVPDHPIFPTFRHFRNGKLQYVVNVSLDDGRDEQFLLSELRQEQ